MVKDKVEEAEWKYLDVNKHWQQMKNIMMDTAQITCRLSKDPCRHKETWWRNEEVAEAVREKKKMYGNLKKKKNWQRHGRSTRRVNKIQRGYLLSKGKKQKECASDLNDPNQQNEIFRIAKLMVKSHNITGSNCLEGVSAKAIVDEKGINDSWKEYMEKLMNEENKWDHRIEATVKEGSADCIRMDEVAVALKKIKRHKAPGMSGPVAEITQSTGDIGIHWILDLCNGILKEGCIPEDWKSSMVLPIHKGKGIQWSVDLTEELNCWNMLWKWWKGSLKTEFGSRSI